MLTAASATVPGNPSQPPPRARNRRRWGRAQLSWVLATLLAFSGLGALVGPRASADVLDNGYTHTFFVDDARDVADASPGDGQCGTRFTIGTPAAPSCTLYAAIQEANARPAGEAVLIAVAPSIRLVDGTFASSALIQLNWNTTNNPTPQVANMSTNMTANAGIASTIDADTQSRYWVQHDNVTLDFQGRLGWSLIADSSPNVLLFTGQNQSMRNFTTLTSAEGGIYVGATAVNFSLVNGLVANPASTPATSLDYAIERGVVVVEGAANTSITNVRFQRAYWDAVLLAPASNSSLVIDGLTIDRSSWDQPVNGGGYDPVYNYFVRNWSSAVSGTDISITNNSVRAWGADGGNSDVISLSGGTWNDLEVRGNTFTATVNQAVNPIALAGIGQTNAVVRDNTFIHVTGTRGSTVDYAWVRSSGSTNGVQVFDNRFVGGGNRVNVANQASTTSTSTLPIFRNTMTGVASTTTAANENVVGTTNNIYNSGNATIRTAYPLLATVVDDPPQSCRIDIEVSPPSTTGGTAIPTDAVLVDAYLGRTAALGGDGAGLEQYLGRIVTTQSALPATFSLPYTGAGDGQVVRLQTTEAATGRTSQYSRTVAATGTDTCAPQSWVKQGGWFNDNGVVSATQDDPTSFRDVSFQLRTSEPLGADGLDAGDIVFSGTAPGQQVVSLTKLTDTTWDLVAKANGTGTIVPSIGAGAISDVAGNPSIAPSNSTVAPIDFAGYTDAAQTTGVAGADVDDSVLYNSPLAVTAPDPLQLALAEPGSDTSTFTVSNITVDADGRVTKAPSSPVVLTQQWSDLVPDPALPTPTPPPTADSIARALPTHTNISDTQPTMDTIDRSVDVPVQAIDNHVVDGTRQATLTLAVSSDDPEFDGLLLNPVSVSVSDDDQPVAASSSLAVTADDALADGAGMNTVTATVHNAADQAVSNAAVDLDVPEGTTWVGPDGAPGTADDLPGGAGVIARILTDGAGLASLGLVSVVVGSHPVSARVNDTEVIPGSPQSVTFLRVAVDPAAPGTGFTVSTGDVTADGSAAHTITVTLQDVNGGPATGWEGDLSAAASPADGVTIGLFVPTANPGEYTAAITSTVAGVKAVTVSVADGAASEPLSVLTGGNASASFVAGPPAVGPGLSSVSIDDSSDRPADGIAFHRITAVLADAEGNPVVGAAARLQSAVTDNADAAVTVTTFSETTTPGTYQALVRSTEAGGQQVTVTVDASTELGTVTANFAAGPVDLGNGDSVYSVSAGDQPVGAGQHTVTVTLADANGNPVSAQAAALSATTSGTLGSGTITGFVETATPGTYTATVTSTSAGTKPIDVRLAGAAVTVSGNGSATFVASQVDLGDTDSRFSVSEGDVTVGDGQHGVTVRLADQYGNPVSGQAAQLAAATGDDLGSGAISSFTETGTGGTYLATVTSTVSGGKTIAVTFAGDPVTLDGNDVANFQPGSVEVDNIGTRYTVSTGDQVVGTGTHTITVTLSDANGNPVSGQADGIESTTTADLGTGAISGYTESATPGTYTATITSTVAGGKAITTVFGADRLTVLLDGNDTANFVPAEVDLVNGASGFFVSPGSRPVGTGQHIVTTRLVDQFDNPVSGRAGDLEASTTDGLGSGSVSAFAETQPGTYQATVTSTVSGPKTMVVALGGSPVALDGNGVATFAAAGVDLAAAGSAYSVSGGGASVSGGSHAVTVTLTDAFGNPVAAQASSLAATTADPLGSGSIGPFVEGPPGTYVATITSSVAGGKSIAVTLGGVAVTLDGNGVATFIAGGVDVGNAGTRYSVSVGDQPVGTGSHTVTVTLSDADGNPVSGESAGLAASASGLGAGTVSTFTETGTAGTYQATITSTLAGSKAVTATFGASSLVLDGNGAAVFVAGVVDPTATGSGYAVSGGEASVSGGAHTVTVTLADQYGNAVGGQSAPLAAATSAALGTGSITAFAETATAGTYTATVTSSIAGDKPITVDFATTALTLRGNGTAAFIAGGVDAGNAGTAFSVSSGDQIVGTGMHTVTVTLADATGNWVPGQAVGLSAASIQDLGSGTVSGFTETSTPGTYTATVSSTSAGAKTMTVDFAGSAVTANGNDVAAFVAGDIDLTDASTGYSVSTGAQSVDGGSHQVLVYLADSFGNPVSGLAADLAAATGDDLGTGSITGFVETSTLGTYSATITSSVSGDKNITASYAGTALTAIGNTVAGFTAGDVDLGASGTHYTVSTGDQPVSAGSHTVTVTLTDAAGNPVTEQETLLTATTADDLGSGAISPFTETAIGTYTATVTSTIAGDKAITVDYGEGTGLAVSLEGNGTATFVAGQVDLGDAGSAFSVSIGEAVVVSGNHMVTATLADQFGNPVTGQAGSLAATTGDDLGTGAIAAFTESATPGTYTAAVTSSIAGAKTIAVTFGGSTVTADGNTTATFIAGDVDTGDAGTGFAVSTGDQPVGTGTHTVTVTLADSSGNPVAGRASDLSASTADPLGTGSLSAFTESGTPGTYTASVTSTTSGAKTIAVSVGGSAITPSGNVVAAFAAGGVDLGDPASSYTVSTGDQPVGTGLHSVTVTLADRFGNPVPDQAADMAATAAGDLGTGAVSGFSESGTPGTYVATVSSSIAGGKAITVTLSGADVTLSGNGTASFVAGGADLGNPGSGFTVSAGDASVDGGSHSITVTLADAFGNPVGGSAALLAAATSDELGTGIVTGFVESATPGTYTATITSSVSGVKLVTVTLDGNSVSAAGNATATFVAAGVDLGQPGSAYSVSSGDASVSGGSHTVTITLADRFGNPVPGQAAQLTATTADALGTGAITAVAETSSPGTYAATVTSSISGGKSITVTFGGAEVTLDGNGVAVFVAGGVDPGDAGSAYSVSTGDQPVGTGEHTITATLADANGNPVPGEGAGLAASSADPIGSGSFSAFTESATPGTYTATVDSTVAGAKAVTVTFAGSSLTLDGNGTASFVAGAPDPAAPGSVFTVSIGDQTVGSGSHAVTATLTDSFGNPVPGQAASLLATTADSLGAGSISGFTETATAGTYTATVTSTVAGGKAIGVTLAGTALASSGNDTAAFVAGAIDPGDAGTHFSVSSGDVPVSTGSHLVTITLADQFGNPVSGQAAALLASTADALGSGGVSAPVESAVPGTYTATVTSSVAGPKTIAVTAGGDAVQATGNTVASFIAGGVDVGNVGTAYRVSSGDVPVGTGTHTVTVTLADADGNPVSGQASGLAGSTVDDLGSGAVGSFAETATPGTYTATVSSTSAGAKAVTVTFGGSDVQLDGNGTASFVAGATDPGEAGTAYSISTGDVPVGTGSHTVTVTLADSFGNPVSGNAAALAAATTADLGSGVISGFVESATPGTYTATITSTVSGSKPVTVTVGGAPVAASGNAAASFVAADVDLGDAATSYSVSTGSVTVDGGSHLVTVTLADAFGNPVSGEAGQLTASTADSLGTGTITAFDESATPGVYEAHVTSSASGNKAIEVTFGGDAVRLDGNGVASFVAGGVDVTDPGSGFSVTTGDSSVDGGTHTITVTLADSNGNPVTGQQAGLSGVSAESLGAGGITAFTETGVPGTYIATITSTIAGVKTIAVSFGGDRLTASGNASASFAAGGADLGDAASGYEVSTGSVPVGSTPHTITVTLADSFGNPVGGLAADLAGATSADLGGGAITAFTESATAGTYQAQVTSTVAGAKPITVTLGGAAVTLRGNGSATFTAGGVDPGSSTLVATSPVQANGSDTSTITLSVFDGFGNPVTGAVPVTISSTLGTVGPVTSLGDGRYTATLRSTEDGTATVSATVNGTAIPATAQVVFLDVTAPQPPVLDPSDGGSVTGCAEPGATIEVTDESGAVIGTAVAGPDCRFEVVFQPPLTPGDTVTVTATDPAGNVSGESVLRIGKIWMELADSTREPGQQQRAVGHNFQPGESVSGLLQSTPVNLGTRTADANGDVEFVFTLASNIEAGPHTVTLTGDFSGSVSQTFTVVVPAGLSDTGLHTVLPLLLIGLSAVGIGGAFLFVVRRRRPYARL
ncbi:invasin domain 3-containing protein [Leifsonia sp. NPDC058292]|uniref:invasin domain 3-containing protein n=1 Tax=Leifsonia sp. NPDC058292 TaxID=3346428 RepID=UPI0036DB1C63